MILFIELFKSFTEVGKIGAQRESFRRLARVVVQLDPKYAEFLAILERFAVRIVASGHEQVVGLILAVAETLLSHVVHCVHDSTVLPHPIENLVGTGQLSPSADLVSL